MFAKLLKHELRSTSGLLGILSACALGVGVLGGLLLRFVMNRPDLDNVTEILAILSIVALPFIFLSLIAYAMGGEIYLAIQFYKSKFTDQGYLTFTLPVRGWQVYLASLINMMLWMFIITVVTFLAFACTVVIGFMDTVMWQEMQEIGIMFSFEELEIFDNLYLWSVIQGAIEFISSNVLLITAITLGCVLAKKHKVLASIGMYFAISFAVSIINAVITFYFYFLSFVSMDLQMDMAYIIGTLLHFAVIVGGSVLSVWLMSKKLNLP